MYIYLAVAIALAHVFNEAAGRQQPAACCVVCNDGGISGAATCWRSKDAIDRHVHHSPLPLRHPLIIPQKVDFAFEQTW